ncbi:MAG: RDD family protein [Spirochaetes bacterium]|nr:RDD family protein [Spirochaetota bacterium]
MNKKRIIAGMIDFLITAVIQSVLIFLIIILPLINNQLNPEKIIIRMVIITFISILYMILRDIPGSKSIGKRILKLKIINETNGSNTDLMARLLRNVTWLLGPMEFIVIVIKGYRIGDKIAKTIVVEKN